jgi:hypothetical protein
MSNLIGIGQDLTASPSHTTVRTGHVHGGSMKMLSERGAKHGSPRCSK